jgi:predicted PurR-regulated permease PerM
MSARAVAKTMVVAAGMLIALYLLYLVRNVLGLIAVSIFVAVALGPAVDLFQHRGRMKRGLAILVTYLALLGGVFLIGLLVVPPIVEQTDRFISHLPEYIDDIENNDTIQRYNEEYGITETLREQVDRLPNELGSAAEALRDVTVGVFSALLQLLTILVLSFFLLIDGQRIVEWCLREMGPERERRWRRITNDVYRSVGGYVIGNAAISLIAGVTTYIVLTALDIPFAVPLAVLMAFLDLIPLVGASIAGAVITLVCAIEDFPTAPIVFFAYLLIYQQIENNALQPLIYRRTVALHPLIVLTGVLIGASLLGVLGALLAIPVAGAIQIVVKDWWVLRREPPEPPVDQPPPPAGAREPAGATN